MKRRNSTRWALGLLAAGAVLLTLGLVRLSSEQRQFESIVQEAQQLKLQKQAAETEAPAASAAPAETLMPAAEGEAEEEEEPDWPEIRDSFASLTRQNPDVCGWLHIEGVLDLPVLQRDQTFYVNHGFDGTESSAGALFLDEKNCLWPEDQHYVIYGHNMASGAMFGYLPRYLDAAYWQNHKTVFWETLYGESAAYVVCAVCVVSTEEGAANYGSIRGWRSFDTEESFAAFMEQISRTRAYVTGVSMSAADEYLSLVTCYGSDAERLVVLARKERED